MGRSKLPDVVREKRGTARSDRAVGNGVMSAVTVEIKAPKWLTPPAAKIFKQRVKQVFALGILHAVDEDALALYANAMQTCIDAQKQLNEDGLTVTECDEAGTIIKITPHPLCRVLKDNINTVNTIGAQFGFSPVSRIKLAALARDDKPKNDFNDFIDAEII